MEPWKLAELETGLPGLTPALGRVLAEAASVCLAKMEHSNPVMATLSEAKGAQRKVHLHWLVVDEQMIKSHADEVAAVEYGACGIAAVVVKRELGLSIVEQARRGRGFDYWLGNPYGERNDDPFAKVARLEVSGILKGSNTEVAGRLREKLDRLERFGGDGPAWVVVVEFSQPAIRIVSL